MIRTQSFRARQPRSLLDDLNRESGRIYSQTMASHWRIFRKKGIWLSEKNAYRLNDFLSGRTTLHAHSRDAAQQAFYRACKTAKALKKAGFTDAHYPHKRKFYRTTIWKNTGLVVKDGVLHLKRAGGLAYVRVVLPVYLLNVQIVEARLVYNHKARCYEWHVVTEDGQEKPAPKGCPPQGAPGDNTVAVDLGEIHPAAVCDQEQAVVVSARALRATHRRRNDALSELAQKQSGCKKYSRRWRRLQRAKNRVKRHAERRIRGINHKVSRAVVDFAFERKAGTMVIGDVRDIADGIDKGKTHNRRTSNWTHGQLRQYITYKAARLGMESVLQDEHYTSQTCPCCGNRHKPKGRLYTCPNCKWAGNRDGQVGAANILSAHLFGSLARVQVKSTASHEVGAKRHRHPYLTGKRTPVDTRHVANGESSLLEAAGL